jgi:hypothetical protein
MLASGFSNRVKALTTMPKEKTSVGLLSSPLKCASGLRQLSLPASMPFNTPAFREAGSVFKVDNLNLFNYRLLANVAAVGHDIVRLDI